MCSHAYFTYSFALKPVSPVACSFHRAVYKNPDMFVVGNPFAPLCKCDDGGSALPCASGGGTCSTGPMNSMCPPPLPFPINGTCALFL